jgi:hypothetical protein
VIGRLHIAIVSDERYLYLLKLQYPEIFRNSQHRLALFRLSEQFAAIANHEQTSIGIKDLQQIVGIADNVAGRVMLCRYRGNLISQQFHQKTYQFPSMQTLSITQPLNIPRDRV